MNDNRDDGRREALTCKGRPKDGWKSARGLAHYVPYMVAVAQLVEHQFVVLRVAGSKPVGHPKAAGGEHEGAPYTARLLRL